MHLGPNRLWRGAGQRLVHGREETRPLRFCLQLAVAAGVPAPESPPPGHPADFSDGRVSSKASWLARTTVRRSRASFGRGGSAADANKQNPSGACWTRSRRLGGGVGNLWRALLRHGSPAGAACVTQGSSGGKGRGGCTRCRDAAAGVCSTGGALEFDRGRQGEGRPPRGGTPPGGARLQRTATAEPPLDRRARGRPPAAAPRCARPICWPTGGGHWTGLPPPPPHPVRHGSGGGHCNLSWQARRRAPAGVWPGRAASTGRPRAGPSQQQAGGVRLPASSARRPSPPVAAPPASVFCLLLGAPGGGGGGGGGGRRNAIGLGGCLGCSCFFSSFFSAVDAAVPPRGRPSTAGHRLSSC